MRYISTLRLLLSLTVLPLAMTVAGCSSSPQAPSDEVIARQNQQSIRNIQNDDHLPPQAKSAMIAAMKKNAPDSVKAIAVEESRKNASVIQSIQNDPKLTASQKQQIVSQMSKYGSSN